MLEPLFVFALLAGTAMDYGISLLIAPLDFLVVAGEFWLGLPDPVLGVMARALAAVVGEDTVLRWKN